MQQKKEALKNYISKLTADIRKKSSKRDKIEKQITAFLDEHKSMKREDGKSYIAFYSEKCAPLHKQSARLYEDIETLKMKRRVATRSYAELVAQDIRDVVKDGGILAGVPVHFKKFSETVKKIIEDNSINNFYVYIDYSYTYSLYLDWSYNNQKGDSVYICDKKNGAAVVNSNMKDRKVYSPEDIETSAKIFLKEQRKFFNAVDALEKKAKELGSAFPYFRASRKGPSFIYGAGFLDRY